MRSYLSNIRKAWSIERQEALLDERVPGWRDGAVYRDMVPPRKRMGHGPGDLKQRASLLRPTGRARGDTVAVASLSLLAWTITDLFTALAGLAARGDTLTALAEDVTVPPDAGAVIINAAADAFQSALHKAEGVGPAKGGRISGEKRKEAAKARCATIADRWPLPSKDFPTKALCEEAGVARATAFEHLGDRREVQKDFAAKTKRAAANQKRRKSDV